MIEFQSKIEQFFYLPSYGIKVSEGGEKGDEEISGLL